MVMFVTVARWRFVEMVSTLSLSLARDDASRSFASFPSFVLAQRISSSERGT